MPQRGSYEVADEVAIEPADNINQVKSKKKKSQAPTPDGLSGKTMARFPYNPIDLLCIQFFV